MTKTQYANLMRKKFQVHHYVHTNKNCEAKHISAAIDYTVTAVNTRLRELIEEGLVTRSKPSDSLAYTYTSLAAPTPIVDFVAQNKSCTAPSLLLSKLWKPGHLELAA